MSSQTEHRAPANLAPTRFLNYLVIPRHTPCTGLWEIQIQASESGYANSDCGRCSERGLKACFSLHLTLSRNSLDASFGAEQAAEKDSIRPEFRKEIEQGLKPDSHSMGFIGATEVVPFRTSTSR